MANRIIECELDEYGRIHHSGKVYLTNQHAKDAVKAARRLSELSSLQFQERYNILMALTVIGYTAEEIAAMTTYSEEQIRKWL